MKHFGAHRNANKLGDIELVCYKVLKEFLFFCKEMINYALTFITYSYFAISKKIYDTNSIRPFLGLYIITKMLSSSSNFYIPNPFIKNHDLMTKNFILIYFCCLY